MYGTRLLTVSSLRCAKVTRAAILVIGPLNGEIGRPEPPQGAELIRHELPLARSDPDVDSGADCRVRGSWGPQQQEAPRHFVAHLQSRGAALEPRAEVSDAAFASYAQVSATTAKAAQINRQGLSI